MRRSSHISRGMTLAEVLVSVSILAVIMGAIAVFQYNVTSYNRSTQAALTTAQEAQNILKYAAKELRAMAPSANGSYPIAAAATSTITFYSDADGDGVQDQVRYYLADSTLYRGVIKPSGSPAAYPAGSEKTVILATGVRNSSTTPVFEYFTGTYAGTSTAMTYPLTLTAIRLVKVTLNIDGDLHTSPKARTFSTQASLRNLKDNL